MTSYFKTIRGKIILITGTITFLITIVTTSICFIVFQNFLQKNQIQSAEYNLQTASSQISSDMKDIIYLSKWLCSNHEIIRYLEEFYGKPPLPIASQTDQQLKAMTLSSYNRMKEEFYRARSNEHILRAMVAAKNQKNFLQIMNTGNANRSNAAEIIAARHDFTERYLATGYFWNGFVQDPLTTLADQPVLPLIRPIYNQYDTGVLGWSYISVSPTIITSYIKNYPLETDSGLFLTIGSRRYSLDSQGLEERPWDYLVLSSLSDMTLNPDSLAQVIQLDDGTHHTIVSVPVGIEGWYLSEILSQKQLNEQRYLYFLLSGVICLIIFSLGFLLMFLMNYMITRPVSLLRRKIDAISLGDFSKEPSIEWHHELGEIGRGINLLSANIVTLMDRRIQDEKQKKDLEYQILQSQINPHFLYNTLNSIKWMASIQSASGIAEMTMALARLLKNVSKGTAALITLQEELELVNDYFLIQKYRYGGSIQLDCQIESEHLYQCRIHRFTLQPLIENALFHGIEPKGTNGHIAISVREIQTLDDTDLEIRISDDGIGMTTEQIRMILSESHNKQTDFFQQIGLYNVSQRIRYEFGLNYGITITSKPGLGTTMTILIPCITTDQSGREGNSDDKTINCR